MLNFFKGQQYSESTGNNGDRCFDNNELQKAAELYLKQLRICFTQKKFAQALKYSKKALNTLFGCKQQNIIKNSGWLMPKILAIINKIFALAKNVEQKALASYEISFTLYSCSEYQAALNILQYALTYETSHKINALLHASDIYYVLSMSNFNTNNIEQQMAIIFVNQADNKAKTNEEKARVSYKRARMFYRLGKNEWALSALQYALDSLSHFDTCTLGCAIYHALQLYQEGLQLYQKTRQLYPQKIKDISCAGIIVDFCQYGEKNPSNAIKFLYEYVSEEDRNYGRFNEVEENLINKLKNHIFQHNVAKW